MWPTVTTAWTACALARPEADGLRGEGGRSLGGRQFLQQGATGAATVAPCQTSQTSIVNGRTQVVTAVQKKSCRSYALHAFLANQKAIEGKTTFYACRNQTCDKPRIEIQEVIKFLDRIGK